MSSARPAVLMVDDRPENLLALEAVLEQVDADLVQATSGTEALRWLLTNECAVILMDVQMPDIDGYETARAIKGRPRTRNVPIIFLTAINREVQHQLEGYGAGAVDYLAKPFEPAVLRSKVEVLLELFRQSKLIEEQNRQLQDQLDRLMRAEADLQRQAAELERSNAELERFAFVASHDLREPLQVVGGFLELLRDDPARDDAGLLLERSAAGIADLEGLIDQLLTYARASTAEQVLEPIALDELVSEVLDRLGDQARAASVSPTCDPLPTVRADRWQLGRVFHHLLENAIKFRRVGGDAEVHVGISRRGDDWV
ncbi:MAG: sensor histidine kinase, partial [Actinomycetota bacterium]